MVSIDVRSVSAVGCADEQPAMANPGTSTLSTAVARRPWVAPAWERRDTPMEVTMYASQR